jgi:hypothetical protein
MNREAGCSAIHESFGMSNLADYDRIRRKVVWNGTHFAG